MRTYVKDVIFAYSCAIKMFMQYLPKPTKRESNCLLLSLKRGALNAALAKLHVLIRLLQLIWLKTGG